MIGFLTKLFSSGPDGNCIPQFYKELGGKADDPQNEETFLDAALTEGLLYNWDWKEHPEDVVEGVDELLAQRGLKPLIEEDKQRILNSGMDKLALPNALSEADGLLMSQGHRLLSIDTRSDQYCAAVVTEKFYRRWVNVSISKQLLTQDHHRGGGRAPKDVAPRDTE